MKEAEENPCKKISIGDRVTVDVPFHGRHIRFENLTAEQANYLNIVSGYYQLHGVRRSALINESSGWECEDSPTGYCDYVQPDGKYDEDCCIYCGEPDERK